MIIGKEYNISNTAMSEVSSNNKRIVKNTVFLYLRQIIVLLLSLYSSRLILEVLGVEDFGIYNVVGGFVSMFAFLNASMSNGVQRFFNVDIGATKGENIIMIFSMSIYIQLLLGGFIFVVSEALGLWYINNIMVIPHERLYAANWVFQFSILSFLFVILQVPYVATVMAYEKMNFYALLSVVEVTLRLIAILIISHIEECDTLILYSGIIFIITIVTSIMYFTYCKNKFKHIVFERRFNRSLFFKMVSFSGWNVFGSFAYMIKDQGLNMLLNLYFGSVVNAARAVSYQVYSAINGFSSNIFTTFRPQLMQSYSSKDYKRTTSLMFTMSKFTFFLMILIAFPIIIEIDYILELWLGNNVPKQTSLFTIIVILNMLVTNFNPPISQIVHATGNMRKYQTITSLILTLILPISWGGLYLGYPAVSVFWISLIISIFNQAICLIVLKGIYTYSIREYLFNVVIPCLSTCIIVYPISYGVHMCFESNFIRLIFVFVTNVLISSCAIFLIGLTKNERNIILNKINNVVLNK